MKRRMLAALMGIMLTVTPLYAGNGDMIVDGKLGVGTASPLAKLSVVGSSSAGDLSDQIGIFQITTQDSIPIIN